METAAFRKQWRFQDIIALIVIAAIFGNGNFGFGGNNNKGADEGKRNDHADT